MKNELAEQSIAFSVSMVDYYKWLSAEHNEFVMSKQILRSATSIGANIHEANYAISKQDMISKFHIAVKEAAETEYWLIILKNSGYVYPKHNELYEQCIALKKMLVASINTLKTSIKIKK